MEQRELEIILALLKYKELHLRSLAKIINEPHANVSRTAKSLVKKNILDFKLQGRNKTFKLKRSIESLNYIYISEHYKLLKLFNKYPNLSIIAESISSKVNSNLIIIFGSYAKLIAKKDSDIDIYIETTNRKVKAIAENVNYKLSVKIGEFNKSSSLIKEIIKDHILLKGIEYFYEKNTVFD